MVLNRLAFLWDIIDPQERCTLARDEIQPRKG